MTPTPTPTHTAVQLPRLPAGLLNLLGEYSMAREDFGVGTPGALDVWQRLIAAIKEYAADQVKAAVLADRDSRTSSVAPGGLPLAQPNSQEGPGDSVLPSVEPPGATLSPCAGTEPIAPADDYHEWQRVVFTLMGYACGLYAEGKHDMPAWFYGLAEKIARAHVDDAQAMRVRQVATKEAAKYTPQVDRGESSSEGGESC